MNPLPAAHPRVVVAYVRTSSAEQGRAFGPDAQRAAMRAFAQREGLTIAAEFHEDVSGTVAVDDRPVMQDALAAAYQHGASAVLVAERSRLARDEYVAHGAVRALEGLGLRVLYADGSNGDDDSARLLDGIGHVIAAHERRRIVARLKAGRAAKAERYPHARAQGGRVPYGYQRTPSGLVVDAEQAQHVRRIFDLIRNGASVRKVAAILSDDTGRAWHPATVEGIVKRDTYKLSAPGRIVDPRVWKSAQVALASRRKRAA